MTNSGADWRELKPTVLGAIMEHFLSGAPLIDEEAAAAAPDADGAEFFEADDAETVAAIKQLIESHVRPAVAGDGGDIKFRGFRDGTVFLALKGSCSGCPSSTATLKRGIPNLLPTLCAGCARRRTNLEPNPPSKPLRGGFSA